MSNLNDNIIRAMNIILNRAGSRHRAMTHPLHASFILQKTKNIDKYVECGVAKGGVCALVALNNPNAKIYALDAWRGMPKISSNDEQHLKSWEGVTAPYGNEKSVIQSFNMINAPMKNLNIIKGWVEDTIPKNIERLKDIDFLRIDVDWHDPVLFVLENLYFNVKKGGIVLIDDGRYKGCRTAVESFRKKHNITNTIYKGEKYGCAEGEEFWWVV
jgi:hypothetical protein